MKRSALSAAILLASTVFYSGCAGPKVTDLKRCYEPIDIEGSPLVSVTQTREADGEPAETETYEFELGINQIGAAVDYGGFLGEAHEDYVNFNDSTEGVAWGVPISQTVEGSADNAGGTIENTIVWHFAEEDITVKNTYVITVIE